MTNSNSLDIVFMIDTTGSMGSWMSETKEKVTEIYNLVLDDLTAAAEKENTQVTLRLGAISYKDYEGRSGKRMRDQIEVVNLTEDVSTVKKFLNKLQPSGGDDGPEDVAGGLEAATNPDRISWKSNKRILIHIADAPCHGREYNNGGDNYPNGHKDDKDMKKSLRELSNLGVEYTFLNIVSGSTEKMCKKFAEVYAEENAKQKKEQRYIAKFRTLDIGQNTKEFFSVVMQSIRATIRNQSGAVSLESSGDKRVDLFFKTARGVVEYELVDMLEQSWKTDALDTLKLIFYIRDVRGGKGERKIFHQCIDWLIEHHPDDLIVNLPLVAEFGRWEDLLHHINSKNARVNQEIAALYAQQLEKDLHDMNEGKSVSLCAKWAPSEDGHHDKHFHAVKAIISQLKINKKTYRKVYISPLREYLKIVERLMCAKQWSEIEYSKVPSQAMSKLKKAFQKNDPERFTEYMDKLSKGETKVNTATLEPHTIVQQVLTNNTSDALIEAQWDGIRERVKKLGKLSNALVLCDVSDSMKGTPLYVSIAMGALISELSEGPFKNLVISFDENPTFHVVKGKTILERVQSLKRCPWGGSTNFQAVFELILQQAKKSNLPKSAMPSTIYVLSDMQFDYAGKKTNFEQVKELYSRANYDMPKIVFWNLRGDMEDVVASSNDANVALISGFNPSILKAVLNGEEYSPLSVMKQAIDDSRYKDVQLYKSKASADIQMDTSQ